MDGKFTPGPWEIWDDHYTVFAGPAAKNTTGMISGTRCQIAECGVAYDDGDLGHIATKANCRLIAAAPDLLSAAHLVRVELSNLIKQTEANPEGSVCRAYIALVAAMAKAIGETHSIVGGTPAPAGTVDDIAAEAGKMTVGGGGTK